MFRSVRRRAECKKKSLMIKNKSANSLNHKKQRREKKKSRDGMVMRQQTGLTGGEKRVYLSRLQSVTAGLSSIGGATKVGASQLVTSGWWLGWSPDKDPRVLQLRHVMGQKIE